jgi:NAD(P)-dependent dehydrogenase (short-subunit alcohol dehydrogenase family)
MQRPLVVHHPQRRTLLFHMTLKDKIALVTGGSSGIGRASALSFAQQGAKVVVADIDEQGGLETVSLIKTAGGEATFIRTDVSNSTDVEAMVQHTVDSYGRLDCGFNNAGAVAAHLEAISPTHEYPEENFDQVIAVNLKGIWLCMKYEIRQMLKQGGGVIVNTASALGLVGIENLSGYVASKHGVVGITKTAALEYADKGIRINAICPGYIQTPMTQDRLKDPEVQKRIQAIHPIGRVGTPKEVAETVVYLCSDAASFVTGHAMTIDGGWTAH